MTWLCATRVNGKMKGTALIGLEAKARWSVVASTRSD